MLNIDIPGREPLRASYLVADYNGTLARDGKLLPELASLIPQIARALDVHVVTADTFGIAGQELSGLPVELAILPSDQQDERKAEYIRQLGPESCVCIGNGRNDKLMLEQAALGICLIQEEGASVVTAGAADVLCTSVQDALRLLLKPKRLVATLRR